jgi:UDP-N-acetylmuramyl pentapeptide phosphotransferase/UDP-N-acetylglucosamine-1-phosphate transferase
VLPLTVLAVAGIANAVNIIDGFNGLASVVTICMLVSLAYVAWQVGDMFVLVSALTVAGATAGFLIWNYPVGLIFLGDGGAYFIGFMLGELAMLLVMRNPRYRPGMPHCC